MSSSSLRRYSPASAWCSTTTALVSAFRQSCADLAAMPNPSGTSDMDMTTTPSPDLVFSVIRAREDLGTELPKRKERSVSGLSQMRRRAWAARRSNAWTVRWNAPWWVNLPMGVPTPASRGRATAVARRTSASEA
uniref:Uncharacterized protein n=1 Tax=Arundo donax TaxID=35708 RepID=A0A0A9D6Z1_ARUDO